MTQSTSEQFDPVNDGAAHSAESQSNHHSLMVREHEMTGLSPYLASPYGGSYVDGAPGGLNASQLLHALRRRWLLAIIVGLLVGAPLAAALWLITPENYEVVAWLRVGDPQRLNDSNPFRGPEYEQYRKTQAARIRSPIVLDDALNKEGIATLPMLRSEKEPRRYLEDEVMVVAPPDSELLQIKMRGKDPKQLVMLVNAVKDSYIDNVVEAENRENNGKLQLFQSGLNELKSDISRKRDSLVELQKKTNSSDLQAFKFQYEQLVQKSNTIMAEMSKTRDELASVMRRLAFFNESGDKPASVPDYLIERNLEKDDQIADMTKTVGQLQTALQFAMGASRYPDRDPAVKDYKQKLSGAQARLEDRRRQLMPQVIKELQIEMASDSPNDRVTDPDRLEIQRKTLEAQLETDQKNLDEVAAQTANLGTASAQLEGLDQEIKEEERAREKKQEQVDEVSMALKLPPRVRVLNEASVPDAPSGLIRMLVAAFGGIIGFVLGAGTVLGVEYQAKRLNNSSELSTQVGLRVLGTVPNLETLSRAKGLNGASAMQGILAESVDSIRAMLLRQSRDENPHLIVVTSAGDREGKTTVASHLAASLARAGRRTLLVDGDLRAPTVHAMFSAALEPGLSEILRGEIDFEGAIQPTPVDGLMLVAAGACDYQAIASLSKEPLVNVFTKAREQFDFVIIDAAPILTYADTLLMSSHADAAVISVRRDVSQLPKVLEAKERMQSVGIKVLGAVVNGITETSRRPAFASPA